MPKWLENALANSARAQVVEPCIVRSFLKFTAVAESAAVSMALTPMSSVRPL